MPRYECPACGAVYLDPQRDGMRYFHACAPVHNPEYDAQFTRNEKGDPVPKGPLDPMIPDMVEHPTKRDETREGTGDRVLAPKEAPPRRDTL